MKRLFVSTKISYSSLFFDEKSFGLKVIAELAESRLKRIAFPTEKNNIYPYLGEGFFTQQWRRIYKLQILSRLFHHLPENVTTRISRDMAGKANKCLGN